MLEILQWIQRSAVPVPLLARPPGEPPLAPGGISSLRAALHPFHLLQLLGHALPVENRGQACAP